MLEWLKHSRMWMHVWYVWFILSMYIYVHTHTDIHVNIHIHTYTHIHNIYPDKVNVKVYLLTIQIKLLFILYAAKNSFSKETHLNVTEDKHCRAMKMWQMLAEQMWQTKGWFESRIIILSTVSKKMEKVYLQPVHYSYIVPNMPFNWFINIKSPISEDGLKLMFSQFQRVWLN